MAPLSGAGSLVSTPSLHLDGVWPSVMPSKPLRGEASQHHSEGWVAWEAAFQCTSILRRCSLKLLDHGQEGQPVSPRGPGAQAPAEGSASCESTVVSTGWWVADTCSPAFTPSATRTDITKRCGLGAAGGQGTNSPCGAAQGVSWRMGMQLAGEFNGEREVGAPGRGMARAKAPW